MPYDLSNRLVIGIASSALFDLTDSHAVFLRKGVEGYRRYQAERVDKPLAAGVAFPFIQRLLSLNDLAPADDPLVEVIVLSRNDIDSGRRVMNSIEHHNLGITRAIFTSGATPYLYMPVLHMSLFLSANEHDVRSAVALGLSAGQVVDSAYRDDQSRELRIGFDFDGVLASDESERIFQEHGLKYYAQHERTNAAVPLHRGPLHEFLRNINRIQEVERQLARRNPAYSPRVRVAVVTARDGPAVERAVRSLEAWRVTVDQGYFLGGIDKGGIMEQFRPHMYFDDQRGHLESTAKWVPSVHVPFGRVNELPETTPASKSRELARIITPRAEEAAPRRRRGSRNNAATARQGQPAARG